MSSFLVSREGITILADGIDDMIKKGKIADFNVECKDVEDVFKDSTIDDIFVDLNFLNAYALKERYDDSIDSNIYYEGLCDISEYTIDSYLKMLDCFLYQCCEGDTVKMSLYKALGILQKKIAMFVNRDGNPLYDEASWG